MTRINTLIAALAALWLVWGADVTVASAEAQVRPGQPSVNRPQSTPRARPSTPRVRPQSTPRVRPQSTPRVRPPQSTPRVRPQSTPQVRPQSTPRVRPQSTPRVRPQSTPRVRPQSTPRVRPQSTPQVRPQSTPRVRPQSTPRVRPQSTPRVRPQSTPRVRPQSTPRVRPQSTPQSRTRPTERSRTETPSRSAPRYTPRSNRGTVDSSRGADRYRTGRANAGSGSATERSSGISRYRPTAPRLSRDASSRDGSADASRSRNSTRTRPIRRWSRDASGSSRAVDSLRRAEDGTGTSRLGTRFGERDSRSTLGRGGIASGRSAAGAARPARAAATGRAPARLRPIAGSPSYRGPTAGRAVDRRVSGRGYLTPPPVESTAPRSSGGHGRSSSSLSIGLFVGGSSWGLGFGYSEFGHRYWDSGSSYAFHFGFGGGPWYANSYLHGAGYSPYWYSHYWGSPLYRGARWSLGFGRYSRYHFGYSHYVPYARYSPYPLYRWGYYEPYYVSCYALTAPVYRTYYYVRRPVTYTSATTVYYDSFVEASDPYVEEEVVVDVSEIDDIGYLDTEAVISSRLDAPGYGGFPSELSEPFLRDFPTGLTYEEYMAYGEEALFEADYLGAAEAFRRACLMKGEDDYAKFQLGAALLGAGRYTLAAIMIERGLDQNPAWLHRRFDLADVFAAPEEFQARVQDLERHLVVNDGDERARFLLSYAYYFSGNLFGTRSLLRVLEERGVRFRHIDAMSEEAGRRLTRIRERR